MKISAPTNFDFKLLYKLKDLVHDTYGSLNIDSGESVFPGYALPINSLDKLKDYVNISHKLGIKFNYIMNNPNIKLNRDRISFLDKLAGLNVDMITLAEPKLIAFVKKEFPFTISSSIACKVDTFEQAIFYKDLGCDIICLDYTKNKDLSLIKEVKLKTGAQVKLLVNNICLNDCPFRSEHFDDKRQKGEYFETQILKCLRMKLQDISLIQKTGFIHPEELSSYQDIGVDFIKIAGRTKPTDWIVNCVSAYCKKEYKGNLFNLMNNSVIESRYRVIINLGLTLLPNYLIKKVAYLLHILSKKRIFKVLSRENNVKSLLRIYFSGEIFYMDKNRIVLKERKKRYLLKEINKVFDGAV